MQIIRVISDSLGETGEMVVKAIMKQFPNVYFKISRYSNIVNKDQIDAILAEVTPSDPVISTIVIEDLRNYLIEKANQKSLMVFDILGGPIKQFEKVFGQTALGKPAILRVMDDKYFSKISAIEFTMKYDDGRDSRGLQEADVVLIGVSRTSKTPTCINLAVKGYRAINVPLVPEIDLPRELFSIDPRKIVGLVIDPVKLNSIRKERLKKLGIYSDSSYSDYTRIREELDYANLIMQELGVKVIDVTESTIEMTAMKVIEILNKNFNR